MIAGPSTVGGRALPRRERGCGRSYDENAEVVGQPHPPMIAIVGTHGPICRLVSAAAACSAR